MPLHRLTVVVESSDREISDGSLSARHYDALASTSAWRPHFDLLERELNQFFIGICSWVDCASTTAFKLVARSSDQIATCIESAIV